MVHTRITIAIVLAINIENTLLVIKLSMTVMDDMGFSTAMLDNPRLISNSDSELVIYVRHGSSQ